jgi:hypothetical protein
MNIVNIVQHYLRVKGSASPPLFANLFANQPDQGEAETWAN